jgi:transcriptional regulator with XRE-family HTH domain
MTFGERMLALMAERGVSLRKLAKVTYADAGHLSRVSRGLKPVTEDLARRLDDALDANGELVDLASSRNVPAVTSRGLTLDDEIEAMELARRVAASDMGEDTFAALEATVDDLASAYPGTPPDELLTRVRRHLAYVGKLMDARMTLAERRRLIVVGGWLSLLAATCGIDLHQRAAASARLRTAAAMAQHAGHPEILAWCLETEAWQAITDGDYRRAVDLAQGAQRVAPRSGSAFISRASSGSWHRCHSPTAPNITTGTTRPRATPTRPPHWLGLATRAPSRTRAVYWPGWSQGRTDPLVHGARRRHGLTCPWRCSPPTGLTRRLTQRSKRSAAADWSPRTTGVQPK